MTTQNDKRLIEVDFPLEQVSLDSVHEKNVRHGHISTLHIWPARRPLAACRAALIAHDPLCEADLAWQVRAWGRWVLAQAKKRLAHRYPTYAEFQARKSGGCPYEPRPLELLEPEESGNTDVAPLNAGFPKAYLADPRNPHRVAKPTVAYLWARTVRCKGCRATIPLLKTRWLAKKENKRVVLTMAANAERTGVVFGVENNIPVIGGNAATRREHDKRRGAGTMTRSGAQCPCCPTIMGMEDIRLEGRAGRLGAVMTAVVVDGPDGKEYRLPAEVELRAAVVSKEELEALYAQIPFGLPAEPTPRQGPGAARAFSVENYGLDQWAKLFTNRQLLAMDTFVHVLRELPNVVDANNYAEAWAEALIASITCAVDRLADASSSIAHWQKDGEFNVNTFQRFALPISWGFSEISPISQTTGNFLDAIDWVSRAIDHFLLSTATTGVPNILRDSAIAFQSGDFDAIVTDPPYYGAIPYSDIMDFFYIWLRRTLGRKNDELCAQFRNPLGPKWDHRGGGGELIDDASRFGGDKALSRKNYEERHGARVPCLS